MTKTLLVVVAVLLVCVAAFAGPVVTSLAPSTATLNGGTHVIVQGSGFSNCIICSPPFGPVVFFGGTRAQSTQLISENTIEAVTPPHLPATVPVTVNQFDGKATAAQLFTFTGNVSDAFETILVPVFNPPVHGAFGSEFHTIVRGSTNGDLQTEVPLYGDDRGCLQPGPGPIQDPLTDPLLFSADGRVQDIPPDCSNWPARMFYVPKSLTSKLTLNARVADVSRSAESLGTEIPIVRSREIRSERIVLLGVPIDPRFRLTLRIYSSFQTRTAVNLTMNGQSRPILLEPGRSIFEPSIAVFTDFPRLEDLKDPATGMVRVTIDPPPPPPDIHIPPPATPIWAFITVTNNVTQQITTITPDLE